MGYLNLSRSNFIHLLRWTSAFIVVFNHLRSIVFKDFPLIKQSGVLTKLFYLLTGLGHQAVIVFFVLSGYLIAGSVISQMKKAKFNIKEYALKRVSRLYAVLLFALLLTLVLDHTGIYFDKIGLYTGKVNAATLGFAIANRLSIGYFLSSLFMLQTIVLPPIGSNSPLWSLAYEFWYYVLFPGFALTIVFIRNKSNFAFITILVLIALITFLPINIELSFLIWLIGLIPFYLSLKNGFFRFFFLILFISWVSIKKVVQIDDLLYDFILAFIVAFWIASFDNYKQIAHSGLLKINEKLSSFSYTTYLVHFPIIMLVLTIIKSYCLIGIWMEPGFLAYVIFIGVFLFVIICSYFIATFTEFKTPQFNAFLTHLFQRRKQLQKSIAD
jgi:peptidoglycan/LPS O-acetylase OafA/YrhL